MTSKNRGSNHSSILFSFLCATAISLFVSSCSEDTFSSTRIKKSATFEEDGVDSEIDMPVSVAGAFLYCQIDDDIEVEENESALGCRLTNNGRIPIILKAPITVNAKLKKANGTEEILTEDPKLMSALWHWVYVHPTADLIGGSIVMDSDDPDFIWGTTKEIAIVEDAASTRIELADVEFLITNYENEIEQQKIEVETHKEIKQTKENRLAEKTQNRDNAQQKVDTNKEALEAANLKKDTAATILTLSDTNKQSTAALAIQSQETANLATDALNQAVLAIEAAEAALGLAITAEEIETAELNLANANSIHALAVGQSTDANAALQTALTNAENAAVEFLAALTAHTDSVNKGKKASDDHIASLLTLGVTKEFLKSAEKKLEEAQVNLTKQENILTMLEDNLLDLLKEKQRLIDKLATEEA
ncbi:MAG: hypothetical protein CMP10_21595 [Zetaproteobacteria bacterium]|nr:hypothetical protein [Pseudobdellovibrionaceae bacterium]